MSSPARAEKMPMPALVPNVTSGGAAACNACSRAGFFQVRVEWPPGHEHTRRRANACASHLVEVIELLRAWARDSHLTGGWLTVLAIDPYALPRLAALGIPEPGFAFYSAPVTATPVTAALPEDYEHVQHSIVKSVDTCGPQGGHFYPLSSKTAPRPLRPVASGTGDKADARCPQARRI